MLRATIGAARQPRLGPWLDFEKQKMAVAAGAHQWSGRHYGILACQKSTMAALMFIFEANEALGSESIFF